MKREYRGVTYDTETAEEIGQVSGNVMSDDEWFHAMLYRHAPNVFFMLGIGGEESAFAGGTKSAGGRVGLVPVAASKALELVRDCLGPRILLEVFGPWTPAIVAPAVK